jgi:TonB-dependent starch-binding outer membrane protein SusC
MRNRFFLLLLLFLIANVYGFAQSKAISGIVLDSNNDPVMGANVSVSGTTNGTITDLNGAFTLRNVASDSKLKVSYIGFVTQTLSVRGQSSIKIILKENSETLDEVVVVGYGTMKKSDVTGAMARIGTKELQAMPVKDALQAMQGKTAGVDITTNQRPGETGSIRIRGVRSLNADQGPLYVVDGMVLQNGGIDNINPQDIESIDILKDASATAIYGSRGANGVVLVTTKHGKEGQLSINYAASVTIEKMYDVTKWMNTQEWLDYARLAKYNMGTYASSTPSYTADYSTWGSVSASFANIAAGWSDDHSTWDGSKAITYDWGKWGKQTGLSTEHTLSVSGGTDKIQAYGSFGFLRQEGTQPGQLFKRYTAKTSVDISPKKYFKMGTSMNISWGDQDYGYSFTKSSTGAGDLYSALKGMLPWTVPYDENGDYIRNPAAGDVNIINPINELNYTKNNRQTLRAAGSFYAQIDFGEIFKPLKGLKFRSQFGPEFKYYRVGTFYDASGINGDGNNTASYNNYQTRSYTWDNLIYYDKTIAKDHKIGITLMQSASASHYEYGTMKAVGTATSSELWYNLYSAGSLSSFGTGLTETQMESYMARLNYSYQDKYLLTASIRRDGASQLADGNKWANFPSFALGWRIDQEKFMKNLDWISSLKLRLGMGTTGNSAIDAYGTKGGLTTLYYNFGSTTSTSGYVASDPSQSSPAKMANSKLGWERTTQYNIGLDFGVLKDRINGNFDFYKTKTNDLLMAMSIPSLTGYTSTYANVGKTKGWGIDLQINTVNIKTRNFTWTSNITWSEDRDKISELANGNTEDLNNKWFVGHPINVYYDYVYDGIWKTSEIDDAKIYGRKPGQIKVKDLDDSKTITANDDKKIIGTSRPDWSGGINNTFTYKNVELSFFIYSRWGFMFENGSLTLDGRYQQRKINYWVADKNEDAEYYSPGSNGEAADTYTSSMNYKDGSFIKVRNISLGYTFNPSQLKKLGFGALKVYAQCLNPFFIYKKCNYLDTDLSNYDNNSVTSGSSVTTKALVFGINVSF